MLCWGTATAMACVRGYALARTLASAGVAKLKTSATEQNNKASFFMINPFVGEKSEKNKKRQLMLSARLLASSHLRTCFFRDSENKKSMMLFCYHCRVLPTFRLVAPMLLKSRCIVDRNIMTARTVSSHLRACFCREWKLEFRKPKPHVSGAWFECSIMEAWVTDAGRSPVLA